MNLEIKHSFLVLVAVTFLISCKRDYLNQLDYFRYIENHESGLRKTIAIGNWEYTMQYKPYDYIISTEQQGYRIDSSFRAREEQLKGTAWFNITLKVQNSNNSPLRYGIQSVAEYERRYSYFLTRAAEDISLVYGDDTLHPISYLFETSYNLAPKEVMVVGFELPAGETIPSKTMQLTYFDRVFKNGIIKASFTEESLTQIPKLKI